MKKLLLVVGSTLMLSGCFSFLTVPHEKYCNTFEATEREAFRTLAGNTVSIDCSQYETTK